MGKNFALLHIAHRVLWLFLTTRHTVSGCPNTQATILPRHPSTQSKCPYLPTYSIKQASAPTTLAPQIYQPLLRIVVFLNPQAIS